MKRSKKGLLGVVGVLVLGVIGVAGGKFLKLFDRYPWELGEGGPSTSEEVVDTSAIQLVRVIRVIDGDTIELEGGERVRYLGVDTPEKGEPFFKESTERNREWVEGEVIALKVCEEEPRDAYGRLLGWVYKGPKLVNAELIREGYAYLMILPPCGLEKVEELALAHLEAKRLHLGLWAEASN